MLGHMHSTPKGPQSALGREAWAAMSGLGVPTAQDYLRHAFVTLHSANIAQPLPDVCLTAILMSE